MKKINVENKKIFLWGSKKLGLTCLKYLIKRVQLYSNVELIGVCISTTDIDYNQKIKNIAEKNNIIVVTEKEALLIKGDLGICIGYPHKISGKIIKNFKNGIINLHFAPLPYYRGSKTLSHAILNKERDYGLTFHYLDTSLDTGPIIDIYRYTIPDRKSAKQIITELEKLALKFFQDYLHRMLIEVLPSISQDEIIKKDQIIPRFYNRNSTKDLYKIPVEDSFEDIYRKVRALQVDNKNFPFFEKDDKKIYLFIKDA